jgi:acetyl-CoA C-acetyltransferase
MTTSQSNEQAVYITGVGMTTAGEHWDLSLKELALQAISAARAEASQAAPQAIFVANMLASALSRQTQLGALLADFAGLRGVEAVAIEAAGASGGFALRQAYLALQSGAISSALVVGVEKVTERVTSEVEAAVMYAGDADYESIHGITQTSQAALLMRRYLHEYGLPADALADFSVSAHANGANNPYAMFQKPISRETYARAGILSDPLNLFDAAPLADGAAALFLMRSDALPESQIYPLVQISGSAAATDSIALHDRVNPLVFSAVTLATQEALRQAGLSKDEIDFIELHDRFSVYAALALEAAGWAEPGQGWQLASAGAVGTGGGTPLCTFGGSKARGDIGGATGVYQAAEATLQLQNRAGKAQVQPAQHAMIQCLGGVAATAVTHVLSRPQAA